MRLIVSEAMTPVSSDARDAAAMSRRLVCCDVSGMGGSVMRIQCFRRLSGPKARQKRPEETTESKKRVLARMVQTIPRQSSDPIPCLTPAWPSIESRDCAIIINNNNSSRSSKCGNTATTTASSSASPPPTNTRRPDQKHQLHFSVPATNISRWIIICASLRGW